MFVLLGIFALGYRYKAYVVNQLPPTWTRFGYWVIHVCLPYVPLLGVPALFARDWLLRRLE